MISSKQTLFTLPSNSACELFTKGTAFERNRNKVHVFPIPIHKGKYNWLKIENPYFTRKRRCRNLFS